MSQLLKVSEWRGICSWYVADVHSHCGWKGIAQMMNMNGEQFKNWLKKEYHACITESDKKPDSFIYYWDPKDYLMAHKFLLDVNRTARKKNWQVEKWEGTV